MIKKLKHDRYLEDLCKKISSDYEAVFTNIPIFSKKNRRVAEIDILALKKDSTYDVYEVKCSYRLTKAKKQLHKIKKLLPKINNLFFFCGESGALESIV